MGKFESFLLYGVRRSLLNFVQSETKGLIKSAIKRPEPFLQSRSPKALSDGFFDHWEAVMSPFTAVVHQI